MISRISSPRATPGFALPSLALRPRCTLRTAVRKAACARPAHAPFNVRAVLQQSEEFASEQTVRDIPTSRCVLSTCSSPNTVDPSVLALVLGGGPGTSLFPLTKRRSEPAITFAGSYRLIDVPMSNALNSGIKKVYVLTQYNSQSLNRHITLAYKSGYFQPNSFIEILAAQQASW